MSTTDLHGVKSDLQEVKAPTEPKMVVLLTIHGIGFQVSPEDADEGGYADGLHRELSRQKELAGQLSSDPIPSHRHPDKPRDGAVYVQSHWPPTSEDAEAGLARLDGKLRKASERFAHVALVYSHLEESKPKPLSFLEMCGQSVFQLRGYGKLHQLVPWIWKDVTTALGIRGRLRRVPVQSPQPPNAAPARSASLTPRKSVSHGRLRGGLGATIVSIENDFAAYLLRNDLRERVRAFVREAIIKLAARGDVEGIVINAHSQGTAIAFDVISELPESIIGKIAHIVTSGSHLRKLVQLFNWGSDIGNMPADKPWTNFYDLLDPVADGLCPKHWTPGKSRGCPDDRPTLFNGVKLSKDVVKTVRRPVEDIVVDNVAHSGGALRAHNYFDNKEEFVPKLARILAGARVPQPATVQVP